MEFRADDRPDEGYCPHCLRTLKDVSRSGQGYCPKHRWVYAEFDRPDEEDYCDECGVPLANDAGEGYDGLCGDCADIAEREGKWS